MTEIRHTGLVTKNIEKSLLFWTKYLKFKIHKEMEITILIMMTITAIGINNLRELPATSVIRGMCA